MYTRGMRRLPLIIGFIIVSLTAVAAQGQTFTPELCASGTCSATLVQVNVTAGDSTGATFEAAINHDPGFSAPLSVSHAPLPPGLTITPAQQFLNPPYNPITFRVTAATTAANGPHDILIFFSQEGQEAKRATLRVNVSGGGAAPPSFTLNGNPRQFDLRQGQSQTISVSLTSVNGFQGTVQFSTQHDAGRLEVTPPVFSLSVPANGTVAQMVTVRAKQDSALGDTFLIIEGQSGTLRDSIGVNVNVVAAPPPADFAFSVSAPAGSIVAGQTTTVTATVTPANNFNGAVAISVSAPNNAVTAPPVTMTSPYSPTPITLQIASTASGAIPVTFTAASGTLVKSTTVTLNVQPAQTASFDLEVLPTDLAVTAGQSGTVTVRATGSGGFSGTINVTSPAVNDPTAGITFTPQTFTLTAGESRAVTVNVSPSSRATTAPLLLEFRGTSGTLTDAASFRLTIAPPVTGNAPLIQAITPMAYAPQPPQEFIVIGANFAPGASVSVQPPPSGTIQVMSTRFISPTQLGVTLSITANTPAGRGYLVTVRNPNGATTAQQVVLVVAPQGSLGGPAAVTRVAIEYPIRGQVISMGKGSIAAAHLATSGSGTIIGRWLIRQRGNPNDPGFVFDQFTATVAGGYLVSTDRPCFDGAGRPKTTAHVCASIPMLHRGTYHLELAVDQPKLATPASVPITIQSDSATELTVYRPRGNTTIDANNPEFSWTLVPGVWQYNLEFVRVTDGDEQVAPIVIESSDSTWRPDLRELRSRRGLAPGTYRWRVIAVYPGDLRGQVSEWLSVTFTDVAFTSARLVATVASTDLAAVDLTQEGIGQAQATQAMYTVAPNATLTGGKDQSASGQFTVSTQGELAGGAVQSKLTGDLNYAAGTDPNRLAQESRNWLIDAGTPADRPYGFGAQFGYTTPDFTSGAEFLTSGSAQTGVIGRARSKFGTFSYYQPVSTAIHGVMSGLDEKLEIRSAAFETPEGRPYTLRFIALEVEEPSDEDFGVAGSQLRTFGIYAKYDLSAALSIVGELAHGKVAAEEGGEGRDGAAVRVGLSGAKGTFNYSANVRSIGANFVNPSNRGLTPGGVSDRVMADVNVGKRLGRASLNFGVRRQEQGRSGESTMPRSDETGLNLGITTLIAGTSLNVAANYTGNRGEANQEMFFPATHRDSSGVSTTLSRSFGRVSLSQTLSLQRSEDEINPFSNQTMGSAGLTASGTFFTNLTVSASLNGSRSEGAEQLGTTNGWTASLQPSLALPFLSLSLQPSVSLSRSRNATLASESENEFYNMSLQWSPAWLGNIVAAQVTSSWSRSEAGGAGGPWIRSYQGSVTLRMNKSRGMPWFPTGPAPGTVPPAAPEPARDQAAPDTNPPAEG